MGHAPENTFASFDRALALGADAIEMDVQLTTDDEMVIFHDSDLARITGVSGPVEAASWKDIRTLDAGAWFRPSFRGERVPLFREVLERYKGAVSRRGGPLGFVVELKPQATLARGRQMARAVSRVIERLGVGPRTFVISFAHEYLASVSAPVRKGILFSRRLANATALARAAGADCLCPRKDLVTGILMKEAREKNLGVFVWTANSRRDYDRLLRLGVDGITTNFPDKLFTVLGR
jgi:glycerophosphoryl diester phosphodiesterase